MKGNTTNYGRRKDDIMPDNNELPAEVFNNLQESQKIHIRMLQNIASINTAINDLQHTVKVHDEILITGVSADKPSLLEQVRSIEKYIANIQYWGRFIGGALILQTLGFFAGIIIAIVRFLPLLERLASKP